MTERVKHGMRVRSCLVEAPSVSEILLNRNLTGFVGYISATWTSCFARLLVKLDRWFTVNRV